MKNEAGVEMRKARKSFEQAAKDLCAATERDFPVGTRVRVTIGAAVITGEIETVNRYWWSAPGEVRMRNERTGNQRTLNASTSDIVKIEVSHVA